MCMFNFALATKRNSMNDLTAFKNFLDSLFRPIISEVVKENLQNIKLPPQPETVEQLPDLIKIAEAEKETGYKRGYIYELVSKKSIPFHKVGSSLRFSRKELLAWIKAGRPPILQQAVDQLSTDHIIKNKGGKQL